MRFGGIEEKVRLFVGRRKISTPLITKEKIAEGLLHVTRFDSGEIGRSNNVSVYCF